MTERVKKFVCPPSTGEDSLKDIAKFVHTNMAISGFETHTLEETEKLLAKYEASGEAQRDFELTAAIRLCADEIAAKTGRGAFEVEMELRKQMKDKPLSD